MPRGGFRPGAGRKPKAATLPPEAKGKATTGAKRTPLEVIEAIMQDERNPPALRLSAAVAMLPYVHLKMADQGKKATAHTMARDAATGRFKPASAPLALVRPEGPAS